MAFQKAGWKSEEEEEAVVVISVVVSGIFLLHFLEASPSLLREDE